MWSNMPSDQNSRWRRPPFWILSKCYFYAVHWRILRPKSHWKIFFRKSPERKLSRANFPGWRVFFRKFSSFKSNFRKIGPSLFISIRLFWRFQSKNMTLPFASATSISYNTGITLLSSAFSRVVLITLVRMRQNSVNSASSLKTVVSIDFSRYDFL